MLVNFDENLERLDASRTLILCVFTIKSGGCKSLLAVDGVSVWLDDASIGAHFIKFPMPFLSYHRITSFILVMHIRVSIPRQISHRFTCLLSPHTLTSLVYCLVSAHRSSKQFQLNSEG